MNSFDLLSMTRFGSEGATRVTVMEENWSKILLICLRAGEQVEPCVMDRHVVFLAISGRGLIWTADQSSELRPGVVVTVPLGVERTVRAETDLTLLGIQIADNGQR